MTEKRFVNKGKDIFQYGEWWCSANDEHCADVIVTAMNELTEENEQLKQDKFICLDCKHSGYVEIGCLCEKEDRWIDYKTECKNCEELE